MHPGHLREYAVAHDGLVGCDGNATILLYEPADVIEFVLVDVGACLELVFQNGLHTGQRCVATPLSQSVNRDMQALGATKHRSE